MALVVVSSGTQIGTGSPQFLSTDHWRALRMADIGSGQCAGLASFVRYHFAAQTNLAFLLYHFAPQSCLLLNQFIRSCLSVSPLQLSKVSCHLSLKKLPLAITGIESGTFCLLNKCSNHSSSQNFAHVVNFSCSELCQKSSLKDALTLTKWVASD